MRYHGNAEDQMATINEDAVRRIFSLNAGGVSQPKIAPMINELYEGAHISEELVRKILHRKVFADVEIDDKTLSLVRSRFKNCGTRNIKSRKPSSLNGVADKIVDHMEKADEKIEKKVLITNLMYARMQYERCLNDCRMAEMDIDTLTCWLDIAVEQELLT